MSVLSRQVPTPTASWAFFLDVDGTLLDIAAEPAAVQVPAVLLSTLSRLRELLGGALALVSGRSIADLDHLFRPLLLAAAGQHGAEMRLAPDGPIETLIDDRTIAAIEKPIANLAQRFPGVLLERKGLSIAIHYRRTPAVRAELRRSLDKIVEPHKDTVTLLEGRMVFDVKCTAATKGTAIERFMRAAPFIGRIPVFLGDDQTDEYGFLAVNQAGGHSIRIGTLEGSHALTRIANPAAARAWLQGAVKTIAMTKQST